MQCATCNREVAAGQKVYFRDECPHCGADLHCCKNCGFYDPGASKQCREPSAELVSNKERANYCDYFRPAAGRAAGEERAVDAKKQLEALFKK